MYQPVKKALAAIGDANLYQKLLIAFLFLILTEVNFMLIGPTFIFMNPLFNCGFADELVDESIACDRISECTIGDYLIIQQTILRLLAMLDCIVMARSIGI